MTLISYCARLPPKAARDIPTHLHALPPARLLYLEEAAVLQVFFDDDVSHGVKHELDVLRVRGAGHVGVDLLDVSAHVQVEELHLDVVAGILVSVWAYMRKEKKCFS